MNKTISVDQLPPQVEKLLRSTWEGNESLVLEHNGAPVAAVVPMEEYRKWYPIESEKAFDYELPIHILEAYHELLDKKFTTGLTSEEEVEMAQLDQHLKDIEAAQPPIQSMQRRAAIRDEKWIQRFDEIMTKLRELRNLR